MTDCARCDAPADDLATVADSTDHEAAVCLDCGAAWLREVVADRDAALLVFLGTATPEQREAHERRLRADAAADEETAARDAERRQKERERGQSKKRRAAEQTQRRREAAEAVREQRCAAAGRHVQASGKCSLDEVAAAVGVSRSSMTRLLPHAIDQGFVVRIMGSAGGIAPGPVSVPRDPDRADLDAADDRCGTLAAA